MKKVMEVSDGEGQAQGRPGQEGQAQEEVELCTVCNRTRSNHGPTRHVFTPHGQPVKTSQFARKRLKGHEGGNSPDVMTQDAVNVSQTSIPADMVLRQALIMAGVITPEDLEKAQQHINALTRGIQGAIDNGGV